MSSGILLRPLFVCRNVIIVTILSLTCAGNRAKCNAVLRNCNKVCGCGTGTAPAGRGRRAHQARTHIHLAGRTQRRQVQQAGGARCSRQHAHARPGTQQARSRRRSAGQQRPEGAGAGRAHARGTAGGRTRTRTHARPARIDRRAEGTHTDRTCGARHGTATPTAPVSTAPPHHARTHPHSRAHLAREGSRQQAGGTPTSAGHAHGRAHAPTHTPDQAGTPRQRRHAAARTPTANVAPAAPPKRIVNPALPSHARGPEEPPRRRRTAAA